MPIVAIEIAPPVTSPPELSRALVASCAKAVRDGDCVLTGDLKGVSPTAVAIVRWDADERRVRVEVGTREEGEARWRSRDLQFSEADDRLERWRTAGLTIATLAGEAARAEADRKPVAKEPVTELAAHSRSPRASTQPSQSEDEAPEYWVDVGGLIGSGLSSEGPRLGVWADVGARLGRTALFGTGAINYASAEGPAPLSVQWLVLSAGLGGSLGAKGKGFAVEPAMAFRLERLHAAASEGIRTDSETHFGYGVAVRATFLWQLGVVSPLLGAEGWVNAEPVRFLVHDQYVGAVGSWGGMVVIGARLRIR